ASAAAARCASAAAHATSPAAGADAAAVALAGAASASALAGMTGLTIAASRGREAALAEGADRAGGGAVLTGITRAAWLAGGARAGLGGATSPVVHLRRRDVRARFAAEPTSGFRGARLLRDRKSTRLNSSHVKISYAVFCL